MFARIDLGAKPRDQNTHCQASFSKLFVYTWRFMFENIVFKTIFTMEFFDRVGRADVELGPIVYLNGEAALELS